MLVSNIKAWVKILKFKNGSYSECLNNPQDIFKPGKNSVLPRTVWEQGMGQVSFHTNGFHVKTVMDAKALLNVAHSTQSVCAALSRDREQALAVLTT